MAWTTPTTRATGYLVTAANWNTDLVDNLAYLKGQAGVVSMEAGIASDTDITDDLGTAALRWRNIYGRSVYGNRSRLTPEIRETRITWEDPANANVQAVKTATGAGASGGAGGSGQSQLQVDRNQVGTIRWDNQAEQNNTLDTTYVATKNPYFRLEFGFSIIPSQLRVFMGFRFDVTTGGVANALPPLTENYAGLSWDGTQWFVENCAGGAARTTTVATISAAARHVLEIWIESATAVEFWVDGVLVARHTTRIPTGNLEWTILDISAGGTAGIVYHTLGEVLIQETL